MYQKQFPFLLKKYLSDVSFTEEETRVWQLCMKEPTCLRILEKSIMKDWELLDKQLSTTNEKEERYQKLIEQIKGNAKEGKILRRKLWTKLSAAAAILVAIIFIAKIIYKNKIPDSVVVNEKPAKAQVINPGSNGAVLTLSNGNSIALDSSGGGLVQNSGNAFTFLKNGKRLHSISDQNGLNTSIYNTLTVSKGKQYMLQLEDGTKIWLNSASVLKFPAKFSSKKRLIELVAGEAYLEVVHNATKPFKVKTGEQIVEDVGTNFDIQAYDDEQMIKTTLIEGSVKIINHNADKILSPGEQLRIQTRTGKTDLLHVNTDNIIAWKNGFFSFENASLEEIMKQLSRWYDIKVVYKTVKKDQSFSGKIDRSLPLNNVLEGLLYTKANFKIEENERKVIILE